MESKPPRSGTLTLAAFAKCLCKQGAWLIVRGNEYDMGEDYEHTACYTSLFGKRGCYLLF